MIHSSDSLTAAVKSALHLFVRQPSRLWVMVAIVLLGLSSAPYPLQLVSAADDSRAGFRQGVLTVTTLNDTGPGSLRQAILDANTAPGHDEIVFAAGLTGTILLTTSPWLDITDDLTITGPGAKTLSISGGGSYRMFVINSNTTVSISDLAIINGRAGSGAAFVIEWSTVTLTNCLISGHNSKEGRGGAIWIGNANVTISNCTLSNNLGFSGGAIHNNHGTMTIANSTISGNSALEGGAIENFGGDITLINSTLSHNSSARYGSTLLSYTYDDPDPITLVNTIVANGLGGVHCYAKNIIDNGHNIIDDGSCNFRNPTSREWVDPLLSELGDYGGPTPTHSPLAGSPAIDTGDNSTCALSPVNNQDQRGAIRPHDGDGSGTAACDVGAVEYGSPLTPLIVTNTLDSGPGSLRAVMEYANANPGLDTVIFRIPGSGPHTIRPLSPLPNITDPIAIDGTTQPGYTGTPVIELDGTLAGTGISGLTITTGPSTVRRLVINRFGGNGIYVTGGENTIVGNYIGTDITGTIARPNINHGIYVLNAPNTRIGGTQPGDRNVISGNKNSGIGIKELLAAGAVIQGNFIGTDASGTAALGNGANGIWAEKTPNIVVGGTTSAERNIISANVSAGIRINPNLGGIGGYRIQGNFIGTDVTGTVVLGSTHNAIYMAGHGIVIGGTVGTTPGGSCTGACNLIAGPLHGIMVSGPSSDATIQGNYVGVDVTGAVALGSTLSYGIQSQAVNTTIGGPTPSARNIVVTIWGDGIIVHGANSVVQGNYVGTNDTGTAVLSAYSEGITIIGGNGITIGGTTGVTPGGPCTGVCNLIAGQGRGIQFLENGSNNVIQGNYIGTDVTGTRVLGNSYGIDLESTGYLLIGGTTPAARNIISGNNTAIYGHGSAHNVVIQGNYIGPDTTGTVALGNGEGIHIYEVSHQNLIGGTVPGAGNVISGNRDDAITINYFCRYTVIQGNYIGVDATGVGPMGNGGNGVALYSDDLTRYTTIGGTSSGKNIIAYNGKNGVFIDSNVRDGQTIRYNAIFANNQLGIDLRLYPGDGVNPNDPRDPDIGPNNLQNYPVLTAMTPTRIQGALNSTPSTTFTLDFYSSSACDPTGYGEGERHEAVTTVTTDSAGNASFTLAFPIAIPFERWVTATATHSDGSTSEFSNCIAQPNAPPVNTVPGPQTLDEDTTLIFSSGVGNPITVSDADAEDNPIRITLSVTEGVLTLSGDTGLTFSAGDGAGDAVMTFTGAIPQVNLALDGLIFTPEANFNGDDTLTITTNDQGYTGMGGPQSATDDVLITVIPVNDPPENAVPGPQATDEDTPLILSRGTGNLIEISDVDVEDNDLQITLSATQGTLTLNGASGLTFSAGNGVGDAVMTFTGPITAINTALDGLTYTPNKDFGGDDTLTITTDDQGFTGRGGPQSASDDVLITVNPINDPPRNTVPGLQYTLEGVPLLFGMATMNALSVADVDAGENAVMVTLAVAHGTLTLGSTDAITLETGSGAGEAVITFTGTLPAINAALDGMLYQPDTGYIGADALVLTTDDQGYTGAGGPQTDADQVSIAVGLTAPQLIAPPDGTVTNNNQPVFEWEPVTSATQYRIQIDDDPAFTLPDTDAVIDTTTYTTTVSLADGVTYFWRVQALAGGLTSAWSEVWQLTIDAAHLPAPILQQPKDRDATDDTTPRFQWRPVRGAVAYQLQISHDYTFATLLIDSSPVERFHVLPAGDALDYGVYYWRARAQDAAGSWGAWSAVRTLVVTFLHQPTNAQHVINPTPLLRWHEVADGARYIIQVDRIDGDFSAPVFEYRGRLRAIAPDTPFAPGDYQWRGQVNAGTGWSTWTPAWTFTITPPVPGSPKLLSPAYNSVYSTEAPVFTWVPVGWGHNYQIQIDNTDDFLTPIQDMSLPAGVLNYTAAPLTDSGMYRWRVRAINHMGTAGAWSAIWTFRLARLDAPVLLSPLPQTITADGTPGFSWGAVEGDAGYQIQIDESIRFTSPLQDVTLPAGALTYTADPLPNGSIYWRVRALTPDGQGGKWSSPWRLGVDAEGPAAPVLLTPANRSGTGSPRPRLTWRSGQEQQGNLSLVRQYRVQLASDSGFADILLDATSQEPAFLLPAAYALDYGRYFWRVSSQDRFEQWGDWSTVSRFDVTLLQTPSDGGSTISAQPIFEWGTAGDPAVYHFQLDDTADFGSPVEDYSGQARRFQPAVPLAAGNYYWRVQVDTGSGWQVWMPVWAMTITTARPASAPLLLEPARRAWTCDATPTLTWQAVINGSSYRVQIDDLSDFSSPEQDVTVGGGLFSYIANPLPDGKYSWRVRALNSEGVPGPWSTRRVLVVDTLPPAAPVLVAPLESASSTNPKLRLQWSVVDAAARFELRLDTSPAFPLSPLDLGPKTSYTPAEPLRRGVYWWQVRALDAAGNPSDWSESRSFVIIAGVTSPPLPTQTPVPTNVPTAEPTPDSTAEPTLEPTVEASSTPDPSLLVVESNDARVQGSGSWTAHDTPLASGGQYLYSSGSSDDSLMLSFSGSRLAVLFVQHPALGAFALEIDGVVVQTVNSTASDSHFGARISLSLSAGPHTMRIVPVSGVVAIDAFAVEAVVDLPIPPTEEPVTPEPPPTTPFPTDGPLLTPEPPGGPTPDSPESFGRD